jgi:iron complex outermembrane recepter protein
MKQTLIIVFVLCGIISHAQTLSGTVSDNATGEKLPGAAVYIPDLKTGAITDAKGHYEIKNLPKSKFLVQAKLIGYTTITTIIDFSVTTEKNFSLSVSAIESPEVVITGSAFTSEHTQNSAPVVPVEKVQLMSVGSGNIISALSVIPGVSSISTGAPVSKPVIRGLGYNRIVTVNEGVRQEGQQWGDEHGVEIDEFSADRIEILKGPSSLLYGSDALGGVINILEPILPPFGKIRGELNSKFSTNNSLTANSLMLEGNQNGFVWRLRGTWKSAAPYETPSEKIFNSAFNEKNAGGLIGMNGRWGFSHLHFSRWDSNIGLVEGERDSVTGKLLNAEGNIATAAELKSRELFLPNQNVLHDKVSIVNNFILGKSQLRVNGGWQQNDRKEFALTQSEPELWFHLNTFTYDAKYFFPQRDSVETVIGIGGMSQQNENRGEEFLIPDYRLSDLGMFASVKKTFAKTTLNAGARFDIRSVTGEELLVDSEKVFSLFTSDFSAVTGSVGATFQPDSVWHLKANIGRGFRAPNISEMSANGVHEGTFRYEIGNVNLKPETSLQFDFGIEADGEKITVSLDAFWNMIDNFIYYRHYAGDTLMLDGEPFPVFRYVQGNSTLKGFEFSLDIHPVSNLHFENSVSYVDARNNNLGQPLPFIPPVRIENELRYTFKTKKQSRLSETYIKAALTNVLRQDRIDLFETETSGYTLVNAGIGTHIRMGKQLAVVFITLNNLLDTEYFNHLSRLKEVGIHEQGRNITFGVTVPFGVK